MKFFILKICLLLITAFYFSAEICLSQSSNIGVPPTFNFYKKNYGAAPQNWEIAQSKNGIMYFANNDGLLEFDGNYWKTYKVSNQTIVRSVEIAADGKIFVGAQGELGFFAANQNGALVYNSLKKLLPENQQNFADVWDIEILDSKVFFRTNKYVFKYENEKLTQIFKGKMLTHLAKVKNNIYFHEVNKGLFWYDKIKPVQEKGFDFFKQKQVSGIFNLSGNDILVVTISDGIHTIKNNKVKPFQLNDNNQIVGTSIYCSAKIDEENFAFGTSSKGVFIVNKNGKVIRHVNQKNGLQVNNVLCLFPDNSKNLWLGLNNGIDLIETSSPFSYIYPTSDLDLTGYDIQIFNQQIYFATSNGVYNANWKTYYNPTEDLKFNFIKKTGGQVWDLSVFNDKLLMNHHNGTHIIKNNYAEKIPSNNGAWMQIEIEKNKLLSGNYNGLSLLEFKNGLQITDDFHSDWNESCRIMVQDNSENIWVSHPYRGVFKVKFNKNYSTLKNVKLYNSLQGFPSDLQIYVFKILDEVIFCAEKGVYSYNEKEDIFEPNLKWNKLFGATTQVKKLIEAPNKDLWYVTNVEVGYLNYDENSFYNSKSKNVLSMMNDKLVKGFENIYPFDEENIFFSYDNGFIHFNPKKENTDKTFKTLIRKVYSLNNDSILYNGNTNLEKSNNTFDYTNNALEFTFSSSFYSNLDQNHFQYFLEGFDKKWSFWSKKSEIEYTNLSPGSYVFKVKSKNIDGKISKVASYNFEIKNPWYSSILAIFLYSLVALAALFFLIFIPKRQFEKEKFALQTEHQSAENQRQKQISKLEREKLELEIITKDQENLKLKEEKLKAELNSLKEQISPHFFFNTLNTLSSIIRTDDREHSLDFVENISNVYRYILNNESKDLATVFEELQFLDAYAHLLKKRFGNNLSLLIEIEPAIKNYRIPSMAFQLLVENVVKHNVISKSKTILVKIFSTNNFIFVQNNINEKKALESHGLGLANLNKRYKILTNKEIEIFNIDNTFKVKLPIVK